MRNLNEYLEGILEALAGSVLPALGDGHAKSQLLAVCRILTRLVINGSPVPAESSDAADGLKRLVSRGAPAPLVAQSLESGVTEPVEAFADLPEQYFGGLDMHRAAEANLKLESIKPWFDAVSCRDLLRWEADCLAKLEENVVAFGGLKSAAVHSVSKESIRERLETYLRQRFPLSSELKVTEVTVLPGGRSKLTAFVRVSGCNVLPGKLVLRRDHPSHVTGTTVVTEFPVLVAAHAAGVSVPTPYFVEPSAEPLGGPFIVVGVVSGRRPCNPLGPLKSAPLALAFARQLARLHRVPLGEIDHLFNESRRMTQQTFLAELEALQNIWSGSSPPPSLAIAYAFTWLRRNVGLVDASPVLVHGDASFHNVMASGRRFTALLDWEWAHLGVAAEDLGYCRPAVESAIEWGQFIDAYRRAGGPEVRQEQIDFFSVWGRLRIITMIIAARALYLAGPAHDLEFAHTAIDELYEWYEKLHIDLERVLE